MLERETLAAELNIAIARAGSTFAERCLHRGVRELFFPGLAEPTSPTEIHKRSVALYAEYRSAAPSERAVSPAHRLRGKLRRTTGSFEQIARLNVERAEVLAWCAGVRKDPPAGDVPTQPAASAALWLLWLGGATGSTVRRVSPASLLRARRACAAWGWRLRIQWLHAHRDVIHKDLAKQANYAYARRKEFAQALTPLRLVAIEHDEFVMTDNGPLDHNYFASVALETETLFTPRYRAYSLATGESECSWTLESLWTEAIGEPPGGDSNKWPTK